MTDRIVLNYEPVRRDYYAWHLHRFFRNPVLGWIKVIFLVQVLIVSLAVTFFALAANIPMVEWPVLTWLSAFFLALIAGVVIKQGLFWRRFFKDPNVFEPFKVTITPNGLHFKTGLADSKLKWKSFTALEENKTYFFLPYQSSKVVGQPIPKRAFASAEQQNEFRTLAAARLKTA